MRVFEYPLLVKPSRHAILNDALKIKKSYILSQRQAPYRPVKVFPDPAYGGPGNHEGTIVDVDIGSQNYLLNDP
jgi:hypothetical protein